jgi:hypothetical protein
MPDLPPDDLGIDEHFGHIIARPVSWVVVFLVCAGFLVAGIGLITANPGVFWIGVGVVAAGTILGGVTHAMADVTARVERRHHKGKNAAIVDSEPVR